jgi:hypothetical protein
MNLCSPANEDKFTEGLNNKATKIAKTETFTEATKETKDKGV